MEVAFERYEDSRQLDSKVAEQELLANLERLDQELTRLREAARIDPKAAIELRDRLQKGLRQSTAGVRWYKKHLGNDAELPKFLEAVEKQDAATRLELADLETRIRLLSNKAVDDTRSSWKMSGPSV